MKPTIKAKRTTKSISFLGLDISNWDLGGQLSFRDDYLKNKEQYFSRIESIFFVIDIQNKEKFKEALLYLKEIVNTVLELNPHFSQFFILFHKCDPDIKKKKEILENVTYLKKQISSINSDVRFSFYKTSIYDESSLLKAFSDGVISLSQRAKLIQTLLKEYMSKSFNSATVLLDKHSFIISSRATKDDYERICQEIAPRLTHTLEKLEEWDINTIDIVTHIEFPQDSDNHKEGIIFLRKLDIDKERLYLIALCLNKKVKAKSYELLPILAKNLKNLLESFK